MKPTDWTTVIPPEGGVAETARALLALARTPQDVRTSNAGNEFLVAPYVADAYNKPAQAPAPAAPAATPSRRRSSKKDGEE